MSLAAPSSHHPSRQWRCFRLISWTTRSVEQVRCLSQHLEPQLSHEQAHNYKTACWVIQKGTQKEEAQEFDFLLEYFYLI